MSLLMQALKKAEHAKKLTDPAAEEPIEKKTAPVPSDFPTLNDSHSLEVPPEPVAAFQVPEYRPTEITLSQPDQAAPASPASETVRIEPQLDPQPDLPKHAMSSPAAELTFAAPVALEPPIVQPVAEEKKPLDSMRPSPQLAQSILSAKYPKQSNRIGIFGAGALVILIVAGAGFYYWQTYLQQPPINLVSASHSPSSPILPAPPPNPAHEVAPAQVQSTTTNATTPDATQADYPAAIKAPSERTPWPADRSTAEPDAVQPQNEQAQIVATANQIRISKGTVAATTNSTLNQAYQLFGAGQLDGALVSYKSVLEKDPNNRDAMLGIAAIALKQKQPEQAATLYSKLLDMNPNDPEAIAGLVSLRRGDPQQGESQLKKVLAQNPHSGANLFELGNLYVQQSRWSEAEDAYFRAFETAPNNADYAYNLAISLDRLGQGKLALDYYQKAVTLFAQSPGNFDPGAAKDRIAQLQQSAN